MATRAEPSGERALLLKLLDEAFHKTAWHGPNLRGAIRRVTPAQATWQPRRGRRTIAEIVVHCAYWKYAVRRRILGGKRGSFSIKGSNWFDLPARLTAAQWRENAALLVAEHETLRDAVATASWAQLCTSTKGRGSGPAAHVYGITLHDVYHAGQIQTIKALYKQANRG